MPDALDAESAARREIEPAMAAPVVAATPAAD